MESRGNLSSFATKSSTSFCSLSTDPPAVGIKSGRAEASKTAEGGEETYHLTVRASKETGKGLDKAGKVTVYYTEDAGKKVAHFFKDN